MKIPRSAVNIVFIVSLAAFCFGLFLHSLTYFGIDPRSIIPTTWYSFQIVTALALIPIVIAARRAHERHELPAPPQDKFQMILGGIFVVFALYMTFNFIFTGSFLLNDQSPEMINGNYAMTAHGFSHTVTKAEFLEYSAYEARMNSGHWMALCSMISWELYDYLRK